VSVHGKVPDDGVERFRLAVICVDESAAAAAAEFVFGQGAPWSKQAGNVMETVVGSPAAAMRLADDVLSQRWADEPEASEVVRQVADEADRRAAVPISNVMP
jgi:hypothetical protein